MLSSAIAEMLARALHAERLDEAERRRRLRAHPRRTRAGSLLPWLGDRLVAWGRRLQARRVSPA